MPLADTLTDVFLIAGYGELIQLSFRLEEDDLKFLPGYVTSYLWETVFQKDSFLDILQKFISYQREVKKVTLPDGKSRTDVSEKIIFPRYHQLDVVRKLIAHTKNNGAGHNYLVQHSAGSGKSNSIAWTAYRLASLHDEENKAVFNSVIIVTDRKVLDSQLQDTINGFDHTLGSVVLIDEKKSAKDLLKAVQDGKRIIVTTLQKFPVIYDLVGDTTGKAFAVIVDEAHSSQSGQSAMKLKMALADTAEALAEYAELEGKDAAFCVFGVWNIRIRNASRESNHDLQIVISLLFDVVLNLMEVANSSQP